MNKVIAMGKIVSEVSLYFSDKSGKKYTVFSLEVPNGGKYEKNRKIKYSYIKCVALGKLADFIADKFNRGNSVFISGWLNISRYQNATGERKKDVSVVIEEVSFVSNSKIRPEYSYLSDSKYEMDIVKGKGWNDGYPGDEFSKEANVDKTIDRLEDDADSVKGKSYDDLHLTK